MKMVGGRGGGAKVLKVSQILGITPTKASFDTYEGNVKSVKCVHIVSLRRWLNEDRSGTGGGGGGVKSVRGDQKY